MKSLLAFLFALLMTASALAACYDECIASGWEPSRCDRWCEESEREDPQLACWSRCIAEGWSDNICTHQCYGRFRAPAATFAAPRPTQSVQDRRNIENRVKEILVSHFQVAPARVTPSTTLASLGADELDMVELAMALEEEFRVEISNEDVDGFRTVGDIHRYLQRVVENP